MIMEKIGDSMNLYRIILKARLSHQEKEGNVVHMNLNDPVVQLQREEDSYHFSDVVSVVDDGVLDTSDPVTIAKYKSNLKLLKDRVLESGSIDQFRLIREDDFFPYDWIWRVNSNQTNREYAKSKLAYSLRMAEVRNRIGTTNSSFGFAIPGDADIENQEAAKLAPHFGQVYEPTKFRSTKHFTINTPLSFTGSYNQVKSSRNFIVIDKPDLFCQSGYGYSADYQDAYLDVTHEPLPISEDAIILIEESHYPDLIKDKKVQEQLQERRVVVYRGDEATAVNMVLSQEGVLPYRIGGKFMGFDSRIEDIMIQSMKDFCRIHHLEYAHNHGNMFGTGGHFSDLLDRDDISRQEFEEEFILFMQKKLPEYAGLINSTFYQYPDRIVRAIGSDKVLGAVEQYNEWAHQQEIIMRREYDNDRRTITPEIHTLFVDTLHQIEDYYSSHPTLDDNESHQAILLFFHASSVEGQVDAARQVQRLLSENNKQY